MKYFIVESCRLCCFQTSNKCLLNSLKGLNAEIKEDTVFLDNCTLEDYKEAVNGKENI